MTILKLVFFSWLAILAGMTWTTSEMIAGEISRTLLCLVAFLGGLVGTWATLYRAAHDDRGEHAD